ncbi:hypothetical protein E8E11_004916 [Didymella keratinophila]|nr:hypothetical protein E8E11_004916 [Didymella keratinophila]
MVSQDMAFTENLDAANLAELFMMHTLSPPPGTSAKANGFYNTLATIKIHDEEFQTMTDFIVPAALITSRSESCKNALKQCWIFALYLQILYGQALNLQLPETESATHHAGTDYIILYEIYVLAEFLQDPVTIGILKKYLWDALFDSDYTKRNLRSVPCAEAMHILYDGTTKGCAARKLVLDTFSRTDIAHVLSRDEVWPEELTRELALKLYGKVDWKGGNWSNTDDLLWQLRKEDYFEAA